MELVVRVIKQMYKMRCLKFKIKVSKRGIQFSHSANLSVS